MGNNNWAVKTLVGFLFLIIFTAITTMTSYIVANDEKSRERDTKIEENVNKKFDKITEILTDIRVAQMEIKTEQKYIRKKIDDDSG